MNIEEFENQLAKIGKTLYIHSHDAAVHRFLEFGHDAYDIESSVLGKEFRGMFFCETEAGYEQAFKTWAREVNPRFQCAEVCDACDVLTCTNAKHKHEWGMCGFGRTLQEALVDVIEGIREDHKINFISLAREIETLRDKVKFWNNAWHEQRILTGTSFWRTPYPRK